MEWALIFELDIILLESCLWRFTIPSSNHPPISSTLSYFTILFLGKIFIDTLCTYNYFTIVFFLTFILTLKQDDSAHYYQNSNSCHQLCVTVGGTTFGFLRHFFLSLGLCIWWFECDFSQLKLKLCVECLLYAMNCVRCRNNMNRRPGPCS